MSAAARAISWLEANSRRAGALFGAVNAVGIALIVLAELAGWGWARLIGAGLISLGGLGLGLVVGLQPPGRAAVGWLRANRLPLGMAVAILCGLPAVAALLGALHGAGGRPLELLGVAIGLLLAAAAVFAVVMALRALRQAWGGQPEAVAQADGSNGAGGSSR